MSTARFTVCASALVRELYRLACDEVAGICPKAAELLEDTEPDALAYLDFPWEHHRHLRTNNVQERARLIMELVVADNPIDRRQS